MFKNPEYNSVKVFLLLAVIIGTGAFIWKNNNIGNTAQVIRNTRNINYDINADNARRNKNLSPLSVIDLKVSALGRGPANNILIVDPKGPFSPTLIWTAQDVKSCKTSSVAINTIWNTTKITFPSGKVIVSPIFSPGGATKSFTYFLNCIDLNGNALPPVKAVVGIVYT